MSADATIATTATITPGFTYRRLLTEHGGSKMVHGIVVGAETGPTDDDGNAETVISVIELGTRWSDNPDANTWTADEQSKIVFYPTHPGDWNLALAECKAALDRSIADNRVTLARHEAMAARLALLAPQDATQAVTA